MDETVAATAAVVAVAAIVVAAGTATMTAVAAMATATARCYLSKGGRSEALSEEKYSSFEYFAPMGLLMILTTDGLYLQSKGGRLTSIVGLGRPLNRN